MAQPHAVEVMLRPAVELYSVAVSIGAAALCLLAPWSLALSPLLGLGAAFTGWGVGGGRLLASLGRRGGFALALGFSAGALAWWLYPRIANW